MNITSSVPLNVQPTVEKLHKMYVQTRQQQVDNKRIKFKSKIRIKSKSQGKFIIEQDRENNLQKAGKTISFVNILKQVKTVSKASEEKKSILLPEDYKSITPQRQLIFLKQLVNRRKLAVQIDPNKVSRSENQSQLSERLLAKQKYQSTLSKPQSRLQTKINLQQLDLANPNWDKKIDEYQHYDSIVKSLLSQISTKRSQGKSSRPTISPNKYCQAKQKLIAKMQQDLSRTQPTFCNFKATIKIHPKKDSMIFRMNDNISDTVYEKKITSYVKFLYKINFSNRIYNDLSLNQPNRVYKVKIGAGNNCQLIKMLLKRRFWLQIDNSLQVGSNKQQNKISFIWTQSTNANAHKIQQSNTNQPENQTIKPQQAQKLVRKVKNLKKIQKKSQSQLNNQKILHANDIEQSQYHYYASKNGTLSIYSKMQSRIVTNHIPSNYIIGSKKALFLLLHWYYQNIVQIDPFTYMPKTYNIRSGDINNPVFLGFLKNQGSKPGQVWIVKPGENTNRGNGINVASFNEVTRLIRKKQIHKNGEQKTFIIQQYLKPFLYQSRKFDIRHYLLITSVKGNIKAYWFKEGYIRTSSQKYDIDDLGNQFIHLTNDAIQKKSDLYGKYEPGNKLSYSNFQRYLDQTYPQKKYSFENQILKKMKQITTDLIHASFSFLDPQRNNCNFQLYGMDFMINHKFQPYLIQVNANPCLEISCPVLERIIPAVVQHTLRLALDPLFPPPQHFPISQRYQLSDRILQKLKYQLIFDQKNEGSQIRSKIQLCPNKFVLSNQEIEADEEIFDNDGEDVKNLEID